MKRRQMGPDIQRKFIASVKARKPLYQKLPRDHDEKKLHDLLWEEVAKEMKSTGPKCKRKWKVMRATYIHHLKDNTVDKKPWYLMDTLSFIYEYVTKGQSYAEKIAELKRANKMTVLQSSELTYEHNTDDAESLSSDDAASVGSLVDSTVNLSDESSVDSSDDSSKCQISGQIKGPNPSNTCPKLASQREVSPIGVPFDKVRNSGVAFDKLHDSGVSFQKVYNRKASRKHASRTVTKEIIIPMQMFDDPPTKSASDEDEDPPSSSESEGSKSSEDPGISFFQDVVENMNRLSSKRRRVFKEVVLSSLHRLLEEQEEEIVKFQCSDKMAASLS